MLFTVAPGTWFRRATILACSLPVGYGIELLLKGQLDWPANLDSLPFVVFFCGASVALWIYGLHSDLLVPILAFMAAVFYFSPSAFGYFSLKDFPRVVLVLGILFAPIYWAFRTDLPPKSWNAVYLPTLDGWRAVAILLVILDHCLRGIAADRGLLPPDPFLLGQQGVNLFFGISGLLITWKLLEERQETGSISLRHFYRRRIFRIFPAAFAFLTAMGIMSTLGLLPATRLDLASTVLYFRNFVPVFWPSLFDAHFWSLSLEEQFYLCLPAALFLFGKRRLALIAGAVTLVCGSWRWYFFHYVFTPDLPFSIRFRTDLRVDGLLCGCLVAVALQDEAVRTYVRNILRTPVLLSLLVLFAFLIHRSGERTTLAESVLIPLLLAGTILRPEGALSRVLESRPMRWVGKISYSLYLWQQFFLLCPVKRWPLSLFHGFPLCIFASVAFAAMSYYFLELPMMRTAHSQKPRSAHSSNLRREAVRT
jgi:peptidoglycan/LPS O-acetylase OafA/YrhL